MSCRMKTVRAGVIALDICLLGGAGLLVAEEGFQTAVQR